MVNLQRFCNEALTCSRLSGQNVVPFIGVYSTRAHPFALVFELMGHLNAGEYIRNNHGVGRVELVCSSLSCHPLIIISASQHQMLRIARAVEYLHSLNVVHGNIKIVCPSYTTPDTTHSRLSRLISSSTLMDVSGSPTLERPPFHAPFHG